MTPIEKLRYLLARVPEGVLFMDEVQEAAEQVMKQAEEDAFFIECLQAGGVDNWQWYDESLEPFWEKYS